MASNHWAFVRPVAARHALSSVALASEVVRFMW
jgi:hypothetical protein